MIKYGTGNIVSDPTDTTEDADPQGLPAEQITRTAAQGWTPQDADALDRENRD